MHGIISGITKKTSSTRKTISTSRWIIIYKITNNFQSISHMQSEKENFYHYNVFVHDHDFEELFSKIVDALLEFGVLDNNLCLYISLM